MGVRLDVWFGMVRGTYEMAHVMKAPVLEDVTGNPQDDQKPTALCGVDGPFNVLTKQFFGGLMCSPCVRLLNDQIGEELDRQREQK